MDAPYVITISIITTIITDATKWFKGYYPQKYPVLFFFAATQAAGLGSATRESA